jgi:hypothetical protein
MQSNPLIHAKAILQSKQTHPEFLVSLPMDIILKNLSNIIASIALIFAAISVFISYKSLRDQRKHNIKSIRPILHVGQWDYENDLCVTVKNCGLGIALVKRLSVMNKDTNEVRDHIYAWLPAKLEAIPVNFASEF